MNLYILSEPLFTQSPWYRSIKNGLTYDLCRKKLAYKCVGTDGLCKGENSYAFLLGTNVRWLNEGISECNRLGIHPIILSNQRSEQLTGIYSSVSANLAHSMAFLMSFLHSKGKSRTALYGVNRLSLTNLAQMEQFKKYTGVALQSDDIFYNDGSLNKCSEAFVEAIDNYDSVISVNDFATVSLMRRLSEIGKTITIVSYGDTMLARRYFPKLLTVSMGYESFGRAAVSICEAMNANSDLDCLTVKVKCRVNNSDEDTPEEASYGIYASDEPTDSTDTRFYADSEMNNLLRIENMLLMSDEVDSEIINLLLGGLSYEEISERLFCALNTVKYRVKKMKENCGIESKKELIEMIKGYCDL